MAKSKHVLDVTEDTFDAEVLKSEIPVLVDFWATWCGPCRAMAPVVEKLGEKYAGKVKVVKLDIDLHAEPAERYEIQSIPTFLLFVKGEQVEEITGAVPQKDLEAAIKQALP